MITSDDVLKIIKMKGPVLPTHIARDTKLSLLFAGAYLAELVSNKKVMISNVKIGSSPVYYTIGQESKIEYYTKYLEQPEQIAVGKLKLNQILDDNQLDPVTRVALRNSPDFAVPVKVNTSASIELYWKWFLLPNDVAEQIIRQKVMDKLELTKPKIETSVQEIITPEQSISVPVPEIIKEKAVEKIPEIPKIKKIRQKKIEIPAESEKKEVSALARETMKQTPKLKEEPKVIEQPELEVVQEKALPEKEAITEKKVVKRKTKPKQETIEQKDIQEEQKIEAKTEIQPIKAEFKQETKKIESEIKEIVKGPIKQSTQQTLRPSITDILLNKVRANFDAKDMIISDVTVITKDKELDLIVKLPTAIGEISYFCKAKKKPLSTENDIYAAIVAAQQKGLPAIFVTTGNINKKAKDMIDSQPNLVKFISLK